MYTIEYAEDVTNDLAHLRAYDRAIDVQKNIWSQTSEVLETSEVFREII